MAIGCALFSLVDAQGKLLTDTLHPVQIVWARQMGLFIGGLALILWRGWAILRTRHRGLQIARGVLAGTSPVLFIAAVSFVPLADAVAVSFVAPFIVTVLGATLLREPVGPHRWAAVAVGFIGALIVTRPGLGVVDPAITLVLVAASLFAVRQVLSRTLGGVDPVETTVTYTALAGFLVLCPLVPFFWRWPTTSQEIALLIGIAVLAAVAETFVILALEAALAVVVAPVQYTMLLWGVLLGYFFWGDFPDFWTFIGAGVIIAGGLYVLHRERLAARARASEVPLPTDP